jgi:hypothetical protein
LFKNGVKKYSISLENKGSSKPPVKPADKASSKIKE